MDYFDYMSIHSRDPFIRAALLVPIAPVTDVTPSVDTPRPANPTIERMRGLSVQAMDAQIERSFENGNPYRLGELATIIALEYPSEKLFQLSASSHTHLMAEIARYIDESVGLGMPVGEDVVRAKHNLGMAVKIPEGFKDFFVECGIRLSDSIQQHPMFEPCELDAKVSLEQMQSFANGFAKKFQSVFKMDVLPKVAIEARNPKGQWHSGHCVPDMKTGESVITLYLDALDIQRQYDLPKFTSVLGHELFHSYAGAMQAGKTREYFGDLQEGAQARALLRYVFNDHFYPSDDSGYVRSIEEHLAQIIGTGVSAAAKVSMGLPVEKTDYVHPYVSDVLNGFIDSTVAAVKVSKPTVPAARP